MSAKLYRERYCLNRGIDGGARLGELNYAGARRVKNRLRSYFTMALATWILLPVQAANRYLEEAIHEYNAGHYSQAVGLLGEAESTDFNSAVLHYYLANSLSHINQKTEAIKEYKIALALEPEGQMAEYCRRALNALGAPVGATQPPQAKKDGLPNLLGSGQTPQIVSIFCGCPLCHRTELILAELEGKYFGKIAFSKAMQKDNDPKAREIIAHYNVTRCPTVLFVDSGGNLTTTCTGLISEADLWRNAEQLAAAAAASKDQNKPPVDERTAQFRETIMKEASLRVSNDEKRMEEEIKMIQTEMNNQLSDISRYHLFGRSYDMQLIQDEGQKKIDALRRDFERRKAEVYAAAEARIDAMSNTAAKSSSNNRR